MGRTTLNGAAAITISKTGGKDFRPEHSNPIHCTCLTQVELGPTREAPPHHPILLCRDQLSSHRMLKSLQRGAGLPGRGAPDHARRDVPTPTICRFAARIWPREHRIWPLAVETAVFTTTDMGNSTSRCASGHQRTNPDDTGQVSHHTPSSSSPKPWSGAPTHRTPRSGVLAKALFA